MDPITATAAVISIGSSIMGGIGSARASSKAAKAGRLARKAIHAEGKEDLRRFDIQTRKLESQARGSVYASGLQMSGSSKSYIDIMSTELGVQRNYMQSNINRQGAIARAGGAAQLSAAKATGFSNALSGVMSGASLFMKSTKPSSTDAD